MRLVSYNIFEGLRPPPGEGAERRALDRARTDAARAVVAELNPDILVLNEALFCRPYDNRCTDYAALFGFPHEAGALYDGPWGNCILSRYPIVHWEEFRIYNRGGIRALLGTPEGRLSIGVYHPHPARLPENKAQDFAGLIAGLTGPLLVCGDLNCISPEDDPDPGALIAAFASFSREPERAAQQFIESGKAVFARLAEHGLTDVIPSAGRRYSIPTDLINVDKRSSMRIDHILASKEIEVLAGEVVHSAETNRASDHHPVKVEFRIRRAQGAMVLPPVSNAAATRP